MFHTLAMRLKQEREKAGMSQVALAKKSGLSRRMVEDIERGIQKNPSIGTIQVLASALGIEPGILAFGEDV